MASLHQFWLALATFLGLTTSTYGYTPGAPGSITPVNFAAPLAVTGAANNGSNAVRLTVASTAPISNGQYYTVAGVGGVAGANGEFILVIVDPTHVDEIASVFSGTYTSGGTITPLAAAATVLWSPSPCGDGTINLPSIPGNGEQHNIVNVGVCPANALTISGNGKSIDGGATAVIAATPGGTLFQYSAAATAWELAGASGIVAGPGYAALNAALNLSDVASAATSRTNLGLGVASNVTFGSLTIGADQFGGLFGTTQILTGNAAGQNSIVGEVVNTLPANTAALPSGTLGAGKLTSNGNQVFGLYGRSECRQALGGVCIGTETTAVNYTTNNPDVTLPPSTAIGTATTVPTGMNVTCGVAGGATKDCSIGVYVTNENATYASPIFNTGMYMGLFRQYGLYVDAMPSGNQTSAVIRNNGTGVNLFLQTSTAMVAANTVVNVADSGGTPHALIKQNGDTYANTLQWVGHNAAPTIGACGTGPVLGAFSTDAKGTISVGTGGTTSCVVNFGTAFTQTPVIVITGENVTSLNIQAKSTTSFTVGGAGLSGTGFDYVVMSNGSL